MAEVAGPSMQIAPENSPEPIESPDGGEPEAKKPKLESESSQKEYRLEERLNGILCCAVCLDLPTVAVYQVGREWIPHCSENDISFLFMLHDFIFQSRIFCVTK